MTRQTMYRTNLTIPRKPMYSRRPKSAPKKRLVGRYILITIVLLIGVAVFYSLQPHTSVRIAKTTYQKQIIATHTPTPAVRPVTLPNPCANNTLAKLALVSITERHMWACDGTSVVYGSSVVTGMENYIADKTPVGTYHIYAKQSNLYLDGSDTTGSWHDYVYYWMPFLENQYGIYGFHDATWRPDSAFGNTNPDSNNASHGCVEMPLATAKWLYEWADIGTTVTIEG